MFRNSDIEESLQDSLLINNTQYYVYADSAYVLRPYMMVGFRHPNISDEEVQFNRRMSSARITVEWAFKEVKMYFSHLDYPRKMRVGKSPFGLWYFCACVLTNFHTCVYGSQVSHYFDCLPPTIEEYIGMGQ